MPTVNLPPKVRLIMLSLLISALLVFLFLIPKNPAPFRAVPSQTSLLIEFNGLLQAAKQIKGMQDQHWNAMLNTTPFQNIWTEIGGLEQIFHHNEPARMAFANNRVLAAFSLYPTDNLHPLFVIDIGQAFSIEKILKSSGVVQKFFPYQYQNQTLFRVHKPNNERVVMAQKGHLLIFSNFSYLVEDALSQMEQTGNWWSDNKYLNDLDPSAEIRLFFKPSKWAAQQNSNLLPGALPISNTLVNNLSWIGVAIHGAVVTGHCEAAGFLSKIGGWNGVKRQDLFAVLPENCAFIAWGGFDNRPLFYQEFAKKKSADFERFVLPWVGCEAALVVTEPLTPALSQDRLLVLAVSDSSKAREALESYGKTRGMLDQENIGMFRIYGFPNNALLEPLLDASDKAFQNPYFVQIDNYMIIAPNRAILEVLAAKYIANQTLRQNTDFLQLEALLADKGRGLLILNSAYLPRFLQQLFQSSGFRENWVKDALVATKTGWLAASLKPVYGPKITLDFSHQAQSVAAPASNVYWKTPIAAPASSPVFCIPQPAMPIGSALLVQDAQGQLYCLSPEGNIQWQKHIDGKIISDITGVDYYSNSRNCYLFNTATKVWLIDELGKEVQGYPLALNVKASTGLRVVDFDKNQKINYFIGGENGSIYGFDLYGRVLDGWNPQLETGKPAGALLHFQHKAKDYLAALSSDGLVSVFGRDGKPRLDTIHLLGTFSSPPILDNSTGKPRIICVSQEGLFYSIEINGRVSTLKSPLKLNKHVLSIQEVGIAGSQCIAVMQGQRLTCLKPTSTGLKLLFHRDFDQLQSHLFPLKIGIGLCSQQGRKINLLDISGKQVAGFPLAGSTPFNFCLLGQQNLLVSGDGSSVVAYKLSF